MSDSTDIVIEQLKDITKKHHTQLDSIEKTLNSTPDPATLRHIEHVVKELPATDALKDVVKARRDRTDMFKRIIWGALGTVISVLLLATLSVIWQGIALAIKSAAP